MWSTCAMEYYSVFKKKERDFIGCPVVKTLYFQCGGMGSIPGQGTKTQYAMWCCQKRKEILTQAYNVNGPCGHMLCEIIQTRKDKHCMIPLT